MDPTDTLAEESAQSASPTELRASYLLAVKPNAFVVAADK